MDRRYAAAGAAGAAGMLLALLLVLGVLPGVSTASDDPNPPKNPCGEEVHFFAADVSNNFFGPAAEGDVKGLKDELHRRRCMDPALVVAHAHTWGVPGFLGLNSDVAFVAKIRELRDNPELWRATVTELERVENTESTASIETMSGSYETLYMIDGEQDVPLIRKAAPDKPAFQVLRFTRSNGQVVNLKLDCGFQPVGQFPHVPPVQQAPPAKPVPERPTPTTQPPGTTVPEEGGKDHNDSPVSGNPNDPNEPTRPNTTEPERPTPTQPPQPTVQPPTTVAPPASAPTTTAPPRPPGPGCVDPHGIGICDQV